MISRKKMLLALLAWGTLGAAPRLAAADAAPSRATPDYEGRPPPPPSAGEVALWVPRVILFPLYLVSEYLLRRPLGALITAAERAHIPSALYDFFAFGPDHKAGIAPIALFDFGFRPSVGVYAFWDDAFFKGDDLRMHASTWGADWLAGSLLQRIHFYDRDSVTIKLIGVHRPDYVYYGQGPRTLQSSQSRYGENLIDGAVGAQFGLWRASRIETALGVRTASFYDGQYPEDPSVVRQVAAGAFPLPPGYATGYTAEYNDVAVALDSRQPFPASGSGVRAEVRAQQGNGVGATPDSGWLKYQGALGGFVDITHRRVVSLSATALFSDPLGPTPVPFTELVTLGGDVAGAGVQPMPGFYPGRLVDRSAVTATLHYRWPIGPWLDGSIQAAVGNVFGAHLEGFDPKLLRFSAAIGVETDASPDSNFEIVVGMGTETFEHGGQVDSFRLAVGVSRF